MLRTRSLSLCARFLRPFSLSLISSALLLPLATQANAPVAASALRVLIIGGGPTKAANQVAIESNVRYIGRLLPPGTACTTLFADGDENSASVLYAEDPRLLPVGERLLRLLLQDRDAPDTNPTHYKKPNLETPLNGSIRRSSIQRAFTQIAQEPLREPPQTLFVYFTGHGSTNRKDSENNVFDLWGDDQLSVRDLAKHIERLPEKMPVAVVMVSCHSGAFANLLHEGGNPEAPLTKRDIVGFFAAIKERVAAGCTSEVNEEEYRDFTSYFFAALTGRDRLGRRVTGADYNKDGRVGMDEAYYYTLANDRSIDVPVCTSDTFLRRYVPIPDADVFATRYSDVRRWATPAQRAALDALATYLNRVSGENRLAIAYDDMRKGTRQRDFRSGETYAEAIRRFKSLRQEGRRSLFRRFPDLENRGTDAYRAALKDAPGYLERQAAEGGWKELLEADDRLYKVDSEGEASEIAESHLLRFVRLGKSIVLAKRLRQSDDAALKARFEKIVEAEGRTLLPQVENWKAARQ
jgi:hypothetical protein